MIHVEAAGVDDLPKGNAAERRPQQYGLRIELADDRLEVGKVGLRNEIRLVQDDHVRELDQLLLRAAQPARCRDGQGIRHELGVDVDLAHVVGDGTIACLQLCCK